VAVINASTGISMAFSLGCRDYESYFKTIMRWTSLSMPIVILEQWHYSFARIIGCDNLVHCKWKLPCVIDRAERK